MIPMVLMSMVLPMDSRAAKGLWKGREEGARVYSERVMSYV